MFCALESSAQKQPEFRLNIYGSYVFDDRIDPYYSNTSYYEGTDRIETFITFGLKSMAGKTSPHILSTSTNLLGFCLVVITSLHIAQKSQTTLVDEFTSVVALLLTFSSILSFVSIRTNKPSIEKTFETFADLLFFTSLTGTTLIIVYITITFWNI